MFQVLLFFFLALISEIVGTLGGFGSSVFFVPVAEFFFEFKTVLMLTAILHDFSNTAKLLMFRRHIDFRLLIRFGIPSVLFVTAGAWLSSFLNPEFNNLLLGSFLVVFSMFFFLKPAFQVAPSGFNAVAGGSVAGFFAGLIGTGGAIRGMSLAAFNLEKSAFVATSAGIDFFVDLSRTVVYGSNGYFKPEHRIYIPFLFLVAFIGTWIGKKFLGKMSQETFRQVVLALLLVTGFVLVGKAIL